MGSLFSFISNPFESWIGYLGLFVGSAGVAIILFTVGIRLILSPLQIVQLRSAKAMQRLQPKIQELRKKHGKDRQKLTEETMKLYKEHRVNPAMGCFPMLLQFPVLIGLFWALSGLGNSPHLTVVTKGWLTRFSSCLPADAVLKGVYSITPKCWDHINQLTVFSQPNTLLPSKGGHVVALLSNATTGWNVRSTASPVTNWIPVHTASGNGWIFSRSYTWLGNKYHANLWGASNVHHVFNLFHADFLWLSHGLGRPDPLYILPILAGVTQWVQSRMMMQRSSDPQQQSMNTLMNFMPLIIVIFALRYPSGLSLYWVTSTLIGIIISARITGWGTLPRFDRWLAPAVLGRSSAAVTTRGAGTRSRREPLPPPSNGNLDDSDIGATEDSDNGASESALPTRTSRPGANRTRRGGRRQRGGRRG